MYFSRHRKRENKGLNIRNTDKGYLALLKRFENFFIEKFLEVLLEICEITKNFRWLF